MYLGVSEEQGVSDEELGAVQAIVMAVSAGRVVMQVKDATGRKGQLDALALAGSRFPPAVLGDPVQEVFRLAQKQLRVPGFAVRDLLRPRERELLLAAQECGLGLVQILANPRADPLEVGGAGIHQAGHLRRLRGGRSGSHRRGIRGRAGAAASCERES